MTTIRCSTDRPSEFPHTVRVREHAFGADVGPASGGTDASPGAHDYFDASLATCKALTAMWYAKQKGIPLEDVEVTVDSDASDERRGVYRLRVHVALRGPMTEEQRAAVHRAIGACPIHKLMTTTDVQIETIPEQR